MSANCLPIQSGSRQAGNMVRVGASRNKIGTARGKKSKPLRVPPGKIVKAQALLVQGRSQREVARALRISPMTVAKIIKAEDFQSFIRKQQESVFGIATTAIESFRAEIARNGNLAYSFLKDLGIIPSPEAMAQFLNAATSQAETGEERQARMLACVLLEARKNYGLEDFDFDTARDSEHQKAQASQPSLLRK
jgi:hypothetical protein